MLDYRELVAIESTIDRPLLSQNLTLLFVSLGAFLAHTESPWGGQA
jgi:hypothetical protein